MSTADQFTQAREAALRAARKNALREAAPRSDTIHDEPTGEFGPANASAKIAVAAPITVLTTDTELYEAVRRAVLERHEVSIAANLEQAAELAAAGKCAVLVTDQALTIEASAHISEHLRKHEPAMVSIAVGNRGQDGVLLGLMSAAAVDRFMLKPITPALARIVIESAGKEHQSRKPRRRNPQRTDEVPAFTMRRAATPARREDKTAITQPVRIPPSPPEPAGRIEPASQVVAHEHTADELPENQTVLVPTLSESEPAMQAADPIPEPENAHIPESDTRVEDTQTVIARERLAIEMPTQLPDTGTSAFQPAGIPRPPWVVLIAAVVGVGALVWWVMSQRLPEIDPRQLIGSNLSAAHAALEENRYLDPAERSALHHFSTVLALDPANADAKAGIDRIAEHFIAQAQALIGEGRYAEAVSALQNVRRVRPDHRGVAALEAGLREKLAQQYPQVRKPGVSATQQEVAATAPRSANASKAVRPASVAVAKVSDQPAAAPKRSLSAPAQQEPPALDARVMTDARQAIERKDFDAARNLISGALEMGAAPQDVVALNEALATAERNVAKVTPPPLVAAESTLRTAPAPAPGAAAPALPEPPAQLVLVKKVQPRYPDEARLRGIEGWVDLSFVVSAAGDVIDPRVEDSSMKHLFARPALTAVRQWKYQPRTVDDPSERTFARVRFTLTE
jgi:TonB family protein